MTRQDTQPTTPRPPLRLWPGVLIVAVQWLMRFVVPAVWPATLLYGVLSGLAGGVLVLLWWLFFSRAPWSERLGATGLMIVALGITPFFLHESIATGAVGMLFYILAVPGLCLAFVLWAALSRPLSTGARWATLVAALVLACGAWALVRTGGFDGDFEHDLAWRWSPTPEEELLARAADEPVGPAPPAAATALEETLETTEAEWPGFRGPRRDSVVSGVRIATDWTATPPEELWRRPIGPGWSSFAVHGDFLYTQEQRGEDEVVTCYDATTGEPVWRHQDPVRFWESNAGAGPRATPTLHDGHVYTLGATGLLNALDATDGSVVWSRDVATELDVETPYWGFSGSPLVVDEQVIVAVAGDLAAYDRATGEPLWRVPDGGDGYSSPHRVTLGGVEQILLLNKHGLLGVTEGGEVLWKHDWPGYPIVQPASTESGDLLISTSDHSGLRRLAVSRESDDWTVEERWTSIRLKPHFNDFVVHEGHAYGFDGSILASVDVATGERNWKGGRYGQGQMLLLPDQDLLLVLSEDGELALVSATPDGFQELARHPAIDGKTWNHPVLVGERLWVRNGEEMAAFRLARAGD